MHDGRPKLLFLSQTLPFPPDGGVKIRTFNILRQLAIDFDVTGICFYRRRTTPDVSGAVRGLSEYANLAAFPIPQEHDRVRLLLDHAGSLITRTAYTDSTYRSHRARMHLRSLLADGSFSVVHVDSMDLSAYLPMLTRIPVACTHHNVESDLLRRAAETDHSRARRAYLRHQARLLEGMERRWCPRVKLNVVVSERDAERLGVLAPSARFHVAPNGVDVDYFTPIAKAEHGLVFVGGASWFPNLDAMKFFAKDILPRIRERFPDVPMRWVGRITPELACWAEEVGIEPVGYVEDVRPHLAAAAVVVAPLRVGGGTRLKILDAWGMGKAVVSTEIGAEGLAVQPGANIVLCNAADDFAHACCALLDDAARRARLGLAARRTVERTYDWDGIGEGLREAYHALIGTARAT